MNLLLQMNIVATVLIIAIVIIRALALYRLPKKTFLALWGIAALRLLIPVRTPLPFDIFPDSAGQPMAGVAVTPGNVPADSVVTLPPSVIEQTSTVQFPWEAVWIVGICAIALYFLISWLGFLREAKTSLPCENGYATQWLAEHPLRRTIQIRQSDRISAPLTYGILRPVILLPKKIEWDNEDALRCILTHEYTHIRRFDTLAKLIFAAALCIHWFNPLVWVMYILASRDIELSCDEAATDELGDNKRAAYLHVLVDLEETKTRMAFPLASHFGKHAIHERMSAVMKKRTYTLPILLAALALVLAGCAAAALGISEGPVETHESHLGTDWSSRYTLPDLMPGDTCTHRPQSFIDRGAEVSYRTSDENVVTVDDEGNITAVSPGEATIYITTVETDGTTLEHTAEIKVASDSDQQSFDNGNEIVSGELGQQNFDNYTVAEDHPGVVGAERNTDLPDYVEEDVENEVASGELGQQSFDNYTVVEDHPGLIGTESNTDLPDYVEGDDDNEIRLPMRVISGGAFKRYYKSGYTLIDEGEFELTKENPSAVYEGASDKEIVVSFEDNEPIICLVTIVNGQSSITCKGGFSGEGAVAIELTPGSSYKVEYQLGLKEHPDPTVYTGETVDYSSGVMKVYEIN